MHNTDDECIKRNTLCQLHPKKHFMSPELCQYRLCIITFITAKKCTDVKQIYTPNGFHLWHKHEK